MCIFVLAWCWVFATFLSRETLYTIYFPNLHWKLLSYFFWIIITENLAWKTKTKPNFVDKLCVEITFSGKFAVKLNVAWKYVLRDSPNFALSFIFKFRKYYTVYNSGLKIWLVSGKSEMAQLLNLKFCVYLWRLGVGFSPHF